MVNYDPAYACCWHEDRVSFEALMRLNLLEGEMIVAVNADIRFDKDYLAKVDTYAYIVRPFSVIR